MGSATTSEQQRRTRRARSLRAPAATPGFSRSPPTTWVTLGGAGRLRAGEASPRGSPRTLPSARRRENGRASSSISAPSRLARAGATRPRHSCVRLSSMQRRRSTRSWRSGAWASWRRSRSPKATRSGRPGSWARSNAAGGNRPRPQGEQRRLDEQTRSALASELGEERLAAAHTIGREMTFEQAVAYALQT